MADNTQTADTAALPKGRYEVTQQQFNDNLKDEPRENILPFDLKTVFPDLLNKTTRAPKLVEKIWRRTLDEFMSDYGGAYYPAPNSTFVQIWVDNLPGSAAKAKLGSISQKMQLVYKNVHTLENPDEQLNTWFAKPKEKETKQGVQLSPEMARLMQEGLGENPTMNMLEIWINRVTQAMVHGGPKAPFVTEVFDVIGKATLAYQPMWNAQAELLVGSTPQYRGTVLPAKYTPAEPFRQDLILLLAGCFQLHALASKNIQSLVFVPVRYATLLNKAVQDFMVTFLRLLNPALRKSLIFELRAIPNDGFSPTAKKSIQDMTPYAKAFIAETGVFSKDDFSAIIPSLHAYGIDLGRTAMPEVEAIGILRKYADNHKGRPTKLFARGLTTKPMIKVAKSCGYAYLSGPAVHPFEKFCTAVRRHPIELDEI